MATFDVHGADRNTGADRVVRVQAADISEAEVVAGHRGLLVNRAGRVRAKAPASIRSLWVSQHVLAALVILVGWAIFSNAGTIMQEIAGLQVFLIAAVLVVGGAIVQVLGKIYELIANR